jgi:capsular exopolysaccharide synthesis family protein
MISLAHASAVRRPSLVSHATGDMAEQLVSFLSPNSAAADRYRALRYSLESHRSESGLPLTAITSPSPGDGKTVTVLNLAGAFAQAPDARVLVVDADLRRPSVAAYLGLDVNRSPGLSRALRHGACALGDIVQRLDGLNLSVVPAGPPEPSPCELLNSPRLATLIREARRDFDCVLIDTPPALLPDCRLIERWVDGFLMVVTANKTPRRMLTEALGEIDPHKVFGLVFNADDRASARYYGYYEYGADIRRDAGRWGRWWLRRSRSALGRVYWASPHFLRTSPAWWSF